MAVNVASLSTTLTLNSIGFKNGIAQAQSSISAFSAVSLGAFTRIGSAFVEMAARAASSLPAITVRGFKMGEQLYDASLQTGIAASQLQNLHRVAGLAGIGVDQFDESIIKMNDSIGSALADGKEMAQAFADIGLNAGELVNVKPDEAFRRIVDAMNKLPDVASRTRVIRDIFGRGGGRLLGLTEGGSAGIDAESKRTRGLGLSLSDIEIKNIDRAKDAFSDLRNIVSGFGMQLASRIAPQIEMLSNAVLDFASNTKLAIEAAGWAMDKFNTFLFTIGELWRKLFVGTTGPVQRIYLDERIANAQNELARLEKEDRTGNRSSIELDLKTGEVSTNKAAIESLRSEIARLTQARDQLNTDIQSAIDNPKNAAYDAFVKEMDSFKGVSRVRSTGLGSLGIEPYEGGFSRILGTAAIYSGSQDAQKQAVEELRKSNQKLDELIKRSGIQVGN